MCTRAALLSSPKPARVARRQLLLSFAPGWTSASTSAPLSPAPPGSGPTSSASPRRLPAPRPGRPLPLLLGVGQGALPRPRVAPQRPPRRPAAARARPERRLEPPGWPPLDRLVGTALDLVHSPTPLLVPCRRGKRVVTVHDLFFLKHPDMVEGEIRRDYVRARPRPRAPRGRRPVRLRVHGLRGPPPPGRPGGEDRGHPPRRRPVLPRRCRPTSRWTRRFGACGCRAGHSSTSGAGRSGRTSSPWSWPT